METIYILERHDLPNQKLKLVSDRTIAQSQSGKKFGQLRYLLPGEPAQMGSYTNVRAMLAREFFNVNSWPA